MSEQRDDLARKGVYCVVQVHYHGAFPVKYWKVLLDEYGDDDDPGVDLKLRNVF